MNTGFDEMPSDDGREDVFWVLEEEEGGEVEVPGEEVGVGEGSRGVDPLGRSALTSGPAREQPRYGSLVRSCSLGRKV